MCLTLTVPNIKLSFLYSTQTCNLVKSGCRAICPLWRSYCSFSYSTKK